LRDVIGAKESISAGKESDLADERAISGRCRRAARLPL